MHDTLAEPWTSLRISADVTVEKLSRVGTRGREWLLQQTRQLLLHVVQSGAHSSHLAVEWPAPVRCHEMTETGWLCWSGEIVDDPVRITLIALPRRRRMVWK